MYVFALLCLFVAHELPKSVVCFLCFPCACLLDRMNSPLRCGHKTFSSFGSSCVKWFVNCLESSSITATNAARTPTNETRGMTFMWDSTTTARRPRIKRFCWKKRRHVTKHHLIQNKRRWKRRGHFETMDKKESTMQHMVDNKGNKKEIRMRGKS